MENFNLGDWLLNTVFTASLLSVIGFLFRDMIFKYYENRINIKKAKPRKPNNDCCCVVNLR